MSEPSLCPWCNEFAQLAILEIYSPREFTLDTCCEGMFDWAGRELAGDPRSAAELMRELQVEQLAGHKLRRVVEGGGGNLVLDWQLALRPVTWREAKPLILKYHRHCKPPAGWFFGMGLANGSELIGVATVGRPVSRVLQAQGVCEVNRLCIRDDIAPDLVWNACSMLYGWAAKEARKRKFKRIVTYTMDSESGTSLIAAGWVPEARTKGGSWSRSTRLRTDSGPTCTKIRWAPAWCALESIELGVASRPKPETKHSLAPVRELETLAD